MKILVINCGSSSLKYQLFDMEHETVLAKGLCERIGIDGSALTHKPAGKDSCVVEKAMPDHKVAVQMVLDMLVDPVHGVISDVSEITAVGHRVVHGGQKYVGSVVVDENVIKAIDECADFAPLHNPANLTGIEACQHAMPGVKHVAVFDTAFHQTMPDKAFMYAIPYDYYDKYGVRKYGFHGTSHAFVSKKAIEMAGLDKDNSKVIVCHIGNGGSCSAVLNGKCVDTSMGLTPLEGLIMGTRSGDIDAGVVQYIANKEGKDVNEVLNILNKKSGLLGLSGISSDFRDVTKASKEGNNQAEIALEAFAYRVAKYVGSYAAAMNGVDAIAFTAGVGENDAPMRQRICKYFGYLGITIDADANDKFRGTEGVISTADSKVKVMVIPTNEELKIAQETLELVQ
ncbi:MAG: acetate kinase [Lachnospiraceae bacterium]|nr:acetate kinase [Lachnospiraceae bacterium]